MPREYIRQVPISHSPDIRVANKSRKRVNRQKEILKYIFRKTHFQFFFSTTGLYLIICKGNFRYVNLKKKQGKIDVLKAYTGNVV